MSNDIRKPSPGFGAYVPVLLVAVAVLATGLLAVTLARPAIAQAVAAYLAVLVTIVLAAGAWAYARTNQETLGATREMLAMIRAEFAANRPTVAVDISKAWFNAPETQPEPGEEGKTAVLVHLRAAFTNSSKSSPTTVSAKAAFVGADGQECGTIREITFFRQPRPHQLTLPPGDIVESTLLISGDIPASHPEKLEIELRFSHPFEGQLKPLRIVCARLGAPADTAAAVS